ncbi:receptor-like protein kinase [Gossypium australe]|uniref:Receptor-like protein kinase n=1 Tax=Gossypium australe TaxID=47621 RepID=A0A5B6VCY1_9ROSI|nr:receptor-like protein kinase [Gossypium australe]
MNVELIKSVYKCVVSPVILCNPIPALNTGEGLPCELDQIHDVFHVSMQRKYCSDEVEEDPVKIVARELKVLQNNKISLVKVLW